MKKPKTGREESERKFQGMEPAIREWASKPEGMQFLLETWAHTPEGSEFLEEWLDTPSGRDLLQEWMVSPDGLELLKRLMNSPETIGRYGPQWVANAQLRALGLEILEEAEGNPLRLTGRYALCTEPGPHKVPPGEKARQVKFECSEYFYERLMEEKLQRNLTLQQLAIRALERYIAIPESVHCRIEEAAKKTRSSVVEFIPTENGMTMVESYSHRVPEEAPELSVEQRNALAEAMEVSRAVEAAQNYLEQLPPEKVFMVRDALALDLRYYRRSRLALHERRKRNAARGTGEKGGDN